jgi:hypothetical protein
MNIALTIGSSIRVGWSALLRKRPSPDRPIPNRARLLRPVGRPRRCNYLEIDRRGTMASGFEKSAIDLTNETWEEVERFNACLERLLSRRKSEIVVSGPLTESKTAWKCAVLQQALLFRVTMLARGCTDAWNNGNIVCSMLAARALLETIVLCNFIRDEAEDFADAGDIEAIEKLANEQLFSTKREEMIAGGFGHKAKSILTYVDKFEKKIPGIREHYEFISEWCHPNGSGHLFTYGEINKQNGSVRFSEATERVRGIQGHIMGCFMLILFMEPIMAAFDEIIPKVSEIDPNVGPWILDPTGWGQL